MITLMDNNEVEGGGVEGVEGVKGVKGVEGVEGVKGVEEVDDDNITKAPVLTVAG